MSVDDLYIDLASQRASVAARQIESWPTHVALAQGAECLIEAAAHVWTAALRPGADDAQSAHRVALVTSLLEEAAKLESQADLAE